MSGASPAMWQQELGLQDRVAPSFVRIRGEVEPGESGVPHAHQVARAFDLFGLDGVLCDENAPLVYFKSARSLSSKEAEELHKKFWNHGGAPLLVVVLPRELQVYSSFQRPDSEASDQAGSNAGLVTHLERATAAVQRFVPSVESGEFFRQHARAFHPEQRVDRALLNNLQAARDQLRETLSKRATEEVLDALLCRLVFTCYLFDRGVIGEDYLAMHDLPRVAHLRDILAMKPLSQAKEALYGLFAQLAQDFNGDLFSDDLRAEAHSVTVGHLKVLEDFFSGTDVSTGQAALWPYDFGAIPVETVSAIYERFLTTSDKATGAFYTPRFLAELVLDVGLSDRESLLNVRVFDPSCGSGIFLVGFFNRMAEEWKRAHPRARNERRARELMELLQSRLFGIDLNPTACRIAAFSLYLAYLDQLSPRDIQTLQERGGALPSLIGSGGLDSSTIACGDFFELEEDSTKCFDLVVGNPPWGSAVGEDSAAGAWCRAHERSIPDRQLAAAFMWKAATHANESGRVCLVLPHGTLFNHSATALRFQKQFVHQHAIDLVLNLTDYQRFLFREAGQPALVVAYRASQPNASHLVAYWAPKIDWKIRNAEVIAISEQDRHSLSVEAIVADLQHSDAPQIWKRLAWATPRDHRLLERLSDMQRLRDRTRQPREEDDGRPWVMAQGFQPLGKGDNPERATALRLPPLFIDASSNQLQLCLLEGDCERRDSDTVQVRRGRSADAMRVFEPPHVLVSHGFTRIAFVGFSVSFQHALRGIAGPPSDHQLLKFLAGYLRSPLAIYYLFHSSSNFGVSRQKIHDEELLRIPFPTNHGRVESRDRIVNAVAGLVDSVALGSRERFVDRGTLVESVQRQINQLVYEYFDLTDAERTLVEDTLLTSIPSFRPTRARKSIPAIDAPSNSERARYVDRLCDTLNRWAPHGLGDVRGECLVSTNMGLAVVKLHRGELSSGAISEDCDTQLLRLFEQLSLAGAHRVNTLELLRGVKVFSGKDLYIVKPLARRHWTQTAALNDADEIAGSILMHGTEAYA